ncbi:MAG: hypothetical protein KF819_11120 [Labilithrix sp.]|nr:hypothetical protein [Labilithrix sp.]
MRSTSSLPPRLAALAVAFTVALGCGASNDEAALFASPGLDDDQAPPPAPMKASENDGGDARGATYRGNPLCRVAPGECMPDDDGARVTNGAEPCTDTPDGGSNEGTKACRLARKGADLAPTCALDESGDGGDGAECETGSDCAPGFDCVVGATSKVCRHYCCAGTCEGRASQSGGETFCDVQRLVDVNSKAPVCMPLKECQLLATGKCAANESCAVVNADGDTGCVSIGERQVGDSCDDDHCAANLTCLGQPGNRKCYKLCKVGVPSGVGSCPSGQACKTSTVFSDPSYGICQKP